MKIKYKIIKNTRLRNCLVKIRHYYFYATSKRYREFFKNPISPIILLGLGVVIGGFLIAKIMEKEENKQIKSES